MNSTHAHSNISGREIGAKLKPHGSVCPPFWILTVECAGARSWLFWWRHRLQIASFFPSTLENNVFKEHRFQIAPLWRAFSNASFFSDRFRPYTVDDSRIRSKTAPFSFENRLVWTRPKQNVVIPCCCLKWTKNYNARIDSHCNYLALLLWFVLREFKQIATADADTAAGSEFPPKCDTAHVRRLHPAVARNLTTWIAMFCRSG